MKDIKIEESTVGAFVKVTFAVSSFVLLTWLVGYTTMYLWNNIVSTTFGIFELTWIQAFGLDFFVGYLVSDGKPSGKYESYTEMVTRLIIKYLAYLAIGSLIVLFI